MEGCNGERRCVAINCVICYTEIEGLLKSRTVLPERMVPMEFHEKLQELRKRNGLTQEELAEKLFVSRAAVSKWESGRGYPNIDSLKALAKFFSVTIDELLSGEEALTIAEEDGKEKQGRILDLVYGMLDCSAALFLFLPLFGQVSGGVVQEVSLISLGGVALWLKVLYFAVVLGMVAVGLLTLVLRQGFKRQLSILLNAAAEILFILSRQAYAAVFLFVFLGIKVLLLIKKP